MPSLIDGRGSTHWFRARKNNVTTDDTALTDRITTTRPDNLIPLVFNGKKFQRAALAFFGTDAADENFICAVQFVGVVSPVFPPSNTANVSEGDECFTVHNYTSLACQLDALQGGAGGLVSDSDFIVGAIVPTDTNYETIHDNAAGGAGGVVHSEADLVGCYFLPNLLHVSYLRLQFDLNSSAASANALVKLFNPQ